jgi:asparagine synthase (glutamine-hydrolysing)
MKGLFAWFPLEANKQLFNPNIQSVINEYDPSVIFDNLSKKIPNEKSDLNEMLFWELNTFLVDHNLNYTDKMGMAVGVEVRVPFLDKNLVEFSTRISPHFKLKGITTKYILKKVAERYLPNDIVYRKKGGFGGPVRTWVLNEMEPFIKERLSTEAIEKGNIFRAEEIHKLTEANKRGEIDAAYTIWSLMSINSFMLNINNTAINSKESI